MNHDQDVRRVFEETLEIFLEVVKQDKSILAAILFGSLVDGDVWEKSDIDLILVGNDEKTPYKFYWIEENNLNLQVSVYSRNRFKRFVEQALAGSSIQHVIHTSRILFSKDVTMPFWLNLPQVFYRARCNAPRFVVDAECDIIPAVSGVLSPDFEPGNDPFLC
jgi:predicted nucleotidyltransferase